MGLTSFINRMFELWGNPSNRSVAQKHISLVIA